MPDTVSYAKLRFSSYLELNLLSCWPSGKRKRERNRDYKHLSSLGTAGKNQGSCVPISCLTHYPWLEMLYSATPPSGCLGLPDPKAFKYLLCSSRPLTCARKARGSFLSF